MKTYFVTLFGLLIATTTVAHAQDVDMRKFTCKEAIALPEDSLARVSAWIDGFMSDDDDPASMVVDFSETDADEIKAYCKNNPNIKLLQAVENLEEQGDKED